MLIKTAGVKIISLAILLTFAWNCEKKSTPTSAPCQSGASAPASQNKVVATVGGINISEHELVESLKANLYEMDKKIYSMKKKQLDKLITEKILEQKAKKENMTVDEYKKQKVGVQLRVDGKEIESFYQKNKNRIHGTKEETHTRIRNYLTQKKERNYYKRLLSDARKNKQFQITLEKPDSPTFTVSADNDPFMGDANGKITIIEFSDFECPFCARVKPTIHKLIKEYKGQVKIVFRDFPLSFHSKAKLAAISAECANDQGKFWEYHDKLFDNQRALDRENLEKYAGELKLNVSEFKKCLDDPAKASEVDKDIADAKKLGVKSTPTFFINGKMYSGVLTFNEFKKRIDKTLSSL